ncbi:hypothetical protein GCM10020001_102060 [Nonomuraea salmonea]
MQYRTLGRTGIKVSSYGLGALMFATSVGNPDPAESARVIHKALDAGINLIDTADAYGDSEEVVGGALKGRRDDVVLATKYGRPMGEDPNRQGASRRWIRTAVENSLRRLGTDHIDLYQLHVPDPCTPHRGDAVGAHRPHPRGQDPRDRHLQHARLRPGRGPVGGRAARPGPLPHRAAAVLAAQPRRRTRGAARRAAPPPGRPGVGGRSGRAC